MIGARLARRRIPAIGQAFNRHGLEAVLANFAEEAVLVFPGDARASGVHAGKQGAARWFEPFFAQSPTLRFTVRSAAAADQFDIAGDNIVATGWDAVVVSRNGGQRRSGGVSVPALRRGKAAHIQDFIFDAGSALRALWGEVA